MPYLSFTTCSTAQDAPADRKLLGARAAFTTCSTAQDAPADRKLLGARAESSEAPPGEPRGHAPAAPRAASSEAPPGEPRGNAPAAKVPCATGFNAPVAKVPSAPGFNAPATQTAPASSPFKISGRTVHFRASSPFQGKQSGRAVHWFTAPRAAMVHCTTSSNGSLHHEQQWFTAPRAAMVTAPRAAMATAPRAAMAAPPASVAAQRAAMIAQTKPNASVSLVPEEGDSAAKKHISMPWHSNDTFSWAGARVGTVTQGCTEKHDMNYWSTYGLPEHCVTYDLNAVKSPTHKPVSSALERAGAEAQDQTVHPQSITHKNRLTDSEGVVQEDTFQEGASLEGAIGCKNDEVNQPTEIQKHFTNDKGVVKWDTNLRYSQNLSQVYEGGGSEDMAVAARVADDPDTPISSSLKCFSLPTSRPFSALTRIISFCCSSSTTMALYSHLSSISNKEQDNILEGDLFLHLIVPTDTSCTALVNRQTLFFLRDCPSRLNGNKVFLAASQFARCRLDDMKVFLAAARRSSWQLLAVRSMTFRSSWHPQTQLLSLVQANIFSQPAHMTHTLASNSSDALPMC